MCTINTVTQETGPKTGKLHITGEGSCTGACRVTKITLIESGKPAVYHPTDRNSKLIFNANGTFDVYFQNRGLMRIEYDELTKLEITCGTPGTVCCSVTGAFPITQGNITWPTNLPFEEDHDSDEDGLLDDTEANGIGPQVEEILRIPRLGGVPMAVDRALHALTEAQRARKARGRRALVGLSASGELRREAEAL